MNIPNTFQSLLIFVYFVIPGFVGMRARNFVVEEKDESPTELLLGCILFGLWNFGICSSIVKKTLSGEINLFYGFLIVAVLSPIVQGVLLGLLNRTKILYILATKIKLIRYKRPGEVWTEIFDTQKKLWIRVAVEDNLIYEGKGAIISAETDSKDLFLTDVKVINDKNEVVKDLTKAKGVYINTKDIKIIEIFD
jgi:hypothetical protein